MLAYRNATDVRLVVPLLDHDGNELSVTSISYRITDRAGVEVVPTTVVSDFVAQSPEVVITVPAASNGLAAGVDRDLRAVELYCVVEGNTIVLHENYSIQRAEVLTAGVNSFQSLAQAQFNAAQMPNLAGWDGASEQQRVAALIDARLHLCQLNYAPLNGRGWGQDSLNYIPEGVSITNRVFGGFLFGGDLTLLSAEQYAKLPQDMRAALNMAQIAEANAILGGEPLEDRRRDGLMLDTVGESKQMFRDSQPLRLPVCRRALGYLSKYVTFAKTVGR